MTEVNPTSIPISPQKLADFISVSFDEEGVKDLCFRLNVDYDDLPALGKRNKARELVKSMQHHNRIGDLVETVQQLRPHWGLNLKDLTHEVLAPDDPRLQGVDSLLTEFRHHYQRLREWKELHNHLDETLNVFGQYAAQVERFADRNEPVDLDPLNISWQPVHRRITVLLTWATQDVQFIGQPYQVLDNGERTGEKWAIELAELHQAVNLYLRENPVQQVVTAPPTLWPRLRYLFGSQNSQAAIWREWWRGLRELTRSCDNTLKTHMFMADKELRKTAMELYDLSKEALWN
ncbi:MAG: hypothetical protein R6X32_14300 [Chloroflexota bacterium]